MKYWINSIAICIAIVAGGVYIGANALFIILLILWLNMMIYAYQKIEQTSVLFAFGIAFFVFLLGREFLEQYHLVDHKTKFNVLVNEHLYISLILSILGVWTSFSFFVRKRKTVIKSCDTQYLLSVRKKSRKIFFMVFPFAFAYRIVLAVIISRIGYHGYYTEFASYQDTNVAMSILHQIDLMLPISFCCFISTLPQKKEIKKMLIFYVTYLIITVLGGQRGPFILGILLIFIFCVYMQGIRPSEMWFKRKYLKIGVFTVLPIVAIASSFYGAWRIEKAKHEVGVFDFFYEQGVTSYVVKRAYEKENNIPKDIYVLEFLHSGLFARLLGIPVYHGNTVEHATKGGSFTHALGYVVMGDTYLAGRGTGSSYVAELYYDFGYIGVFLGSCLYGFLFSLIYKTRSVFVRSTIFVTITYLLWACRASYVGFLGILFAPSTLILLLLIFTKFSQKKIAV